MVYKIRYLEKEVCRKNKNQKMLNNKKHHYHPVAVAESIHSQRMIKKVKIWFKTLTKIHIIRGHNQLENKLMLII